MLRTGTVTMARCRVMKPETESGATPDRHIVRTSRGGSDADSGHRITSDDRSIVMRLRDVLPLLVVE
jgi:hypothetical protein